MSQTRDWTSTPGIGKWSLNHWTTREAPTPVFLKDTSFTNNCPKDDNFNFFQSVPWLWPAISNSSLHVFKPIFSFSFAEGPQFDPVWEDVKKVLVCNQQMKTRNPQTAGSLMDRGRGGGLRFPLGSDFLCLLKAAKSQARSVAIAAFLAHQQWLNTNVFNSWTYF